jgi:hypothetical protein
MEPLQIVRPVVSIICTSAEEEYENEYDDNLKLLLLLLVLVV